MPKTENKREHSIPEFRLKHSMSEFAEVASLPSAFYNIFEWNEILYFTFQQFILNADDMIEQPINFEQAEVLR